MKLVFWICAGLIFYAYAGYPLFLLLLRVFLHRPVHKKIAEPSVTVIVPAYNEAAVIADKIHNTLSLHYPSDKFELLIASDGSSDDTVEIADRFAEDRRVRVLPFALNRGKMSVLNDAVRQARGEIIVFTDASALLAADSVRELAANFADPRVGAVSGTYHVLKPSDSHVGFQEQGYWKYEAFLKTLESSIDSVLGGHGHILAVRAALYPFPASETINDDYVIPLRILAGGHRVIYEPRAIAYEKAQQMAGFGRRVRIMAGNLQQLGEIRGLFAPLQMLPLFFFFSHKLLRSFVPFFLLALLISNAFLFDIKFYRVVSVFQLFFYGLAYLGSRWQLQPPSLRLPYYFCFVNTAYLWGVLQLLRGDRLKWK